MTIVPMLYSTTMCLIKASTLFLLYRLFPSKLVLHILHALGLVVVIYSIVQGVCTLVQCLPIESLWNPTVPHKCLNLSMVLIVCSVLNILTDIAMFVLPLTQLRGLKLPRAQKFQLVAIFAQGGFVCAISIIRIPTLAKVDPFDTTCMSLSLHYPP